VRLRDSVRYRQDLVEAVEYYQAISPDLALDLLDCVEEARAHIAANPRALRERREGIRQIVLRRFPLIVRFRFFAERRTVHILSLRHGARKPE
jgi:plasmid stabilization system protein ParE